jgi:hypothetical protein
MLYNKSNNVLKNEYYQNELLNHYEKKVEQFNLKNYNYDLINFIKNNDDKIDFFKKTLSESELETLSSLPKKGRTTQVINYDTFISRVSDLFLDLHEGNLGLTELPDLHKFITLFDGNKKSLNYKPKINTISVRNHIQTHALRNLSINQLMSYYRYGFLFTGYIINNTEFFSVMSEEKMKTPKVNNSEQQKQEIKKIRQIRNQLIKQNLTFSSLQDELNKSEEYTHKKAVNSLLTKVMSVKDKLLKSGINSIDNDTIVDIVRKKEESKLFDVISSLKKHSKPQNHQEDKSISEDLFYKKHSLPEQINSFDKITSDLHGKILSRKEIKNLYNEIKKENMKSNEYEIDENKHPYKYKQFISDLSKAFKMSDKRKGKIVAILFENADKTKTPLQLSTDNNSVTEIHQSNNQISFCSKYNLTQDKLNNIFNEILNNKNVENEEKRNFIDSILKYSTAKNNSFILNQNELSQTLAAGAEFLTSLKTLLGEESFLFQSFQGLYNKIIKTNNKNIKKIQSRLNNPI